MINRVYNNFVIYVLFAIFLILFNYLNYFPINQAEFSNPDFSVTLDKINNYFEINNYDSPLLQYGPGYEYIYKLFSNFNFTNLKNFYLITHFLLPLVSFSFLFILFSFLKYGTTRYLLILTSLFYLEFFIYSTIRYVPIICLSLLILNTQNYPKYLFIIFIFLFGFFFFCGIDYGLIALIAIVLTTIVKKNFNLFDLDIYKLIFYLTISILINHYILKQNFSLFQTIKDLFNFANFFDITDPSFSYPYPFFKFDLRDFFYLSINFRFKEIIIIFAQNFKIFIMYYFPFLQVLIILYIILIKFFKKNLNNLGFDIIFLSSFVFATQIRMLFGPGFIIYNFFQIILLFILFINLIDFKYKKYLSMFFSLVFLVLSLITVVSKFDKHTKKSEITAIDYPINYEGIYVSKKFYDNILNFNQFISDNNIKEAFIYPWSFTTTINKIKKINLMYDDRHLISDTENLDLLFDFFLDKVDLNPYLILDLNYSLGIAFFNPTDSYITNIKDQYSNFSKNSIVFNGEKNKIREYISKNYIYLKSFGDIHLYTKAENINIPISVEEVSFYKNFYNKNYLIKLHENQKANFIDLEFQINQNNFIKKFFGQSYMNIIFFDDSGNIISKTSRPISRSHYNKKLKMRFFIDYLNNKNQLKSFEISFSKIKKFNFLNSEFDINSLKIGNIN